MGFFIKQCRYSAYFPPTQLDSGTLHVSIAFQERSVNTSAADMAWVALDFLSASHTTLSTMTTGSITYTSVCYLATENWSLPIGTRSIEYIMYFTANYGSFTDAWMAKNSLFVA